MSRKAVVLMAMVLALSWSVAAADETAVAQFRIEGQQKEYVVKRNETLGQVAERFGLSVDEILTENEGNPGIVDRNTVLRNTLLKLPLYTQPPAALIEAPVNVKIDVQTPTAAQPTPVSTVQGDYLTTEKFWYAMATVVLALVIGLALVCCLLLTKLGKGVNQQKGKDLDQAGGLVADPRFLTIRESETLEEWLDRISSCHKDTLVLCPHGCSVLIKKRNIASHVYQHCPNRHDGKHAVA